jgi:hypothetical protein
MQSVNEEIRRFNATRFFKKKNEDLDRRLPWGANQLRLRNYAINVIQSLYKH